LPTMVLACESSESSVELFAELTAAPAVQRVTSDNSGVDSEDAVGVRSELVSISVVPLTNIQLR